MPLVELIVVLFAVLAIATPFITLVLLGKYKKLRENMDQLARENSEQHASLEREVADLKRQLSPVVNPGAAATSKPVERPVAPVVKETPAAVKLSTPVLSSTSEKRPEPLPLQKPQEPAPVVPPVAPITSTAPPAQKLPVPPLPIEPRPVLPAAAKSPAEVKPAAPAVPPQIIAPTVPSFKPPAPQTPALSRPASAALPPAAGARVSTAPPISVYRVPAPKPTFQQRMKTVSAIEEALGTNWLPKIGIIMTVIGVALLGILKLRAMGPAGKDLISFLVAIAFLAGGVYIEKRERYRLLGRAGIGGGWALLFFSTYAIHHVAAMRVLDSLTIDCMLMLVVAILMAAHTLQYRSQFVTGLAFLLGYTTVALSQEAVYSLIAGVILGIGLVSIVLKMGWFELEVFGILSSYLNHLYWLYGILGIHGAQGRHFEEYHASLALLFFYWAIFRFSYVVRKIKTESEERVSTVAAVLNMGLLLGCMKFQSVQPELAYIALLAVGAAEFLCAQIPARKRRREAFVVLTVMGTALLLAAAPSHYTFQANDVAILCSLARKFFSLPG